MTKPVTYAMMAFLISGTICYAYLTYESHRSNKRMNRSLEALEDVKRRVTEPVAYEAAEYLKGETA